MRLLIYSIHRPTLCDIFKHISAIQLKEKTQSVKLLPSFANVTHLSLSLSLSRSRSFSLAVARAPPLTREKMCVEW